MWLKEQVLDAWRLDVQLKDWRNKVRELSYDIEDCIDRFMHKMSKEDAGVNLLKKTISMIEKIWARHKIANLIGELKARVEEEALYVEAQRLLGIDGPREKIIEFMKNDDNGHQLKVVSIVGFGGLGKTTLANQNPNVAKILANMLKELGSCVDPSDDERQLIDKIRAFLQDKRYFIIVDDIWSTQAWELINSALPENNLNSRVITTTRISTVATSCCIGLAGYVHNIQPLSDRQSQQLFLNRVFGDISACPPHLEEISRGILKKCHGLPLAIITIASLLAGKSNKGQWEQVYNSINSAFSHQGMRDILLLSYYDLPYNLKTCLLYLSMCPEDYRINRADLIWRWIAEGFITEVRGQTVEQTAESYFNELVNRSLIQPIDIQNDGKAEACRVHDMVLELIVSLSAEENFACIVEGQSYSGSGHKIRRLSVQSEHVGDEVMQQIMDKWSQLPEDIGNLQYLQTLVIFDTNIRKLPPSIGRLQKLVRLFVHPDTELPDEIGDLQALQELSGARMVSTKLVEALRRLTKLKTLYIHVPTRQELGGDFGRYVEALKSSLVVMGGHGLQSLTITGNDVLREEQIDLLCSTAPCLWKLHIWGAGITHVPKQMASLVNLTHLDLGIPRIKQEDLCILGGIPALLFCELDLWHAPDERLTVSSQKFQCLQQFKYKNFRYGGGLEMLFLQEAMPELRRLELNFRAQETESKMGFEFSFEHLESLEHIKVVIWIRDATRSRVEAAEAAVRGAVSMHPGRPTLDVKFY
ncbi:hypothetical protein SORBI_3008G139100 [Sorghum bicolor]|uniref:NB-ARC domain-containing protein n=1 Tax=Sorghum bicolor TaxID=4558 RepID=A0A1Z5R7H8_SORBI|nr:hypothetical protein SORBI_3008G139100 [Sorghum bicolor]